MECFFNYFSSTFITVLSGAAIYLLGQYFHIVWLMPLQEYKKIQAKIACNLLLYANVYCNVVSIDEKSAEWKQEHIEAAAQLKMLAAELEGYIQTLHWFKLGIPPKKQISKATSKIVGLSNCCFTRLFSTHSIYMRKRWA